MTYNKSSHQTLADGLVHTWAKSAHGQDGIISASQAGVMLEGRFCFSSDNELDEFLDCLKNAVEIWNPALDVVLDGDAVEPAGDGEIDWAEAYLELLLQIIATLGVKETASRLKVSRKTVYRWKEGHTKLDDSYGVRIENLHADLTSEDWEN